MFNKSVTGAGGYEYVAGLKYMLRSIEVDFFHAAGDRAERALLTDADYKIGKIAEE